MALCAGCGIYAVGRKCRGCGRVFGHPRVGYVRVGGLLSDVRAATDERTRDHFGGGHVFGHPCVGHVRVGGLLLDVRAAAARAAAEERASAVAEERVRAVAWARARTAEERARAAEEERARTRVHFGGGGGRCASSTAPHLGEMIAAVENAFSTYHGRGRRSDDGERYNRLYRELQDTGLSFRVDDDGRVVLTGPAR